MSKELSDGQSYMTLREIREALGVPRKTLERTVERLFPGKMVNGKTTYLDEYEVFLVSKELKKAHNSNLISNDQVAMTRLEKQEIVLQAMTLLQEEVTALRQDLDTAEMELEEARPKVEFYDDVTGSPDTMDMAKVAKILDMGVGRNKIFEILREAGILQRDNTPYQRYVDSGDFRLIENRFTVGDTVKISLKTVVTQKGLDRIRKFLKKHLDNE